MTKRAHIRPCINCHQRRACLLVEVYTPAGDGFESAGGVHICRECLAGDFGTIAKYLLEQTR